MDRDSKTTKPLDMTKKEFDEFYPAWQMAGNNSACGIMEFREFVEIMRRQKVLSEHSMLPKGINIIP